jgi:hypothetical protein
MFPGGRLLRALSLIALLMSCAAAFHAQAGTPYAVHPLVADELGKGTIPLYGPWQ